MRDLYAERGPGMSRIGTLIQLLVLLAIVWLLLSGGGEEDVGHFDPAAAPAPAAEPGDLRPDVRRC